MEWNVIFELIDPKLMIVVATCWVCGFILKKTPGVPSWIIPYAVLLLSVLLSCWYIGFAAETVIQGILAGAFAVYGHQLVKQTKQAVKDHD